MLILGLTGDVGAGKSTICRVWKSMGASVFDADSVARDMWKSEEVQKKACARWGDDFFSGEWRCVLKKIADKIFGSEEEYSFASSLLHKATIKELKNLAANAGGLVILEIPLLYECGEESMFDGVIYASASLEKRAERNVSRGWNKSEIMRRENRLMDRAEKIRRSDWVLENDGTADEWEEKAVKLGKIFLSDPRVKD